MPNGMLILIPTGSNKTYFHKQLSKNDKKNWLDGEKILKKAGIRNKLQYWYNEDTEKHCEIIEKIKRIIYKIKKRGFNIILSANPLKIKANVLILTNMTNRWNTHRRNKENNKWAPSEELFILEQQSYESSTHKIPIVFNGDIPNIKILKLLQTHINFKDEINSNISIY